ncbi:uncharacterized protein FFC1_01277 [Fusarium fujikuroi]|nr:uncharacterized protein FFC1_01277 [Fusarium fujikuroi]
MKVKKYRIKAAAIK